MYYLPFSVFQPQLAWCAAVAAMARQAATAVGIKVEGAYEDQLSSGAIFGQ
jgi:hypothetical protein